jgi:hypothetical protein
MHGSCDAARAVVGAFPCLVDPSSKSILDKT